MITTIEDVRKLLHKNVLLIQKKIEHNYLYSTDYGVGLTQNKWERLYFFHDLFTPYLPRLINSFTLPDEVSDTTDFVNLFIIQALRSPYYTGCVLDAHKNYKRFYKSLPLLSQDEMSSGKYEGVSIDNLEDKRGKDVITQDILEKAYNSFSNMLNTYDDAIFSFMRQGNYNPAAITRALNNDLGYEKSEDQVRRTCNFLEYRLVAWMCLPENQVLVDSVLLKGLNRFPSLNNRYLGIKKLETLPDIETLKAIALNRAKKVTIDVGVIAKKYDPQVKSIPHSTKKEPWFASKVDLNGKRHDHDVVYINGYGSAYDQVNRRSENLCSLEL